MAIIDVTPVELLALKKLALINNALAMSLNSETARSEQISLVRVLVDVIGRASDASTEATQRNG